MARTLRRNRWGFVRLIAVLSLTAVALFVASAPAWAHHPVLSGETACPGPDHVVTWTIGNSEPVLPMTIVSATAVLSGTTYAVTGYTSPVPAGASTQGTTTIPGNLTGTVTLTVRGDWSDSVSVVRSVSVDLFTPCEGTTTTTGETTTTTSEDTTTTSGETTTTTAESTTTTGETTTTTSSPETTTSGPVVTIETTTTTGSRGTGTGIGTGSAPPGELAMTGLTHTQRDALIGLCILLIGCILACQGVRRPVRQ